MISHTFSKIRKFKTPVACNKITPLDVARGFDDTGLEIKLV